MMKLLRTFCFFSLFLSKAVFASAELTQWSVAHPQIWSALQAATGSANLTTTSVEALGACPFSQAVKSVELTSGTFYSCGPDFKGTLAFLPVGLKEEDAIVLGQFKDDRVESYGTRDVFNANACKEVYSQVGENCFSNIARHVSNGFVPNFDYQASDAMVAEYISSSFSPMEANFRGEKSMCFDNTGIFWTKGLKSEAANNAKEERNSEYEYCENLEGDKRYWANSAWWNIAVIGAVVISVPTAVVSCACPGIAAACCAGLVGGGSSSKS